MVAALLAGFGGRGLGSMLTSAAKGKGAEALLGQKTMPVYVVNAGEISSGVGLASSMGVMGVLGKAGIIGAGATAAYFAADYGLNATASENEYGDKTDYMQDIMLNMGRLFGMDFATEYDKQGRIDNQRQAMNDHEDWKPQVARPGQRLVPTPAPNSVPPPKVEVVNQPPPGIGSYSTPPRSSPFPNRNSQNVNVKVELGPGLRAAPSRGPTN